MLPPPADRARFSSEEAQSLASLRALWQEELLSSEEQLLQCSLFLRRQSLGRLLMLDEIYRLILDQPGSILQCGVRYGGDLVTLLSLRALYEPYHHARRLFGFDTFAGLRGVGPQDAAQAHTADGQFGVPPGYPDFLQRLLESHRRNAPLAHISQVELVAGDVRETMPEFLKQRPGELIALLYLDMDIYEPTLSVLQHCLERLAPGSVIVFDELSDARFPGEALAFREALAGRAYELRRPRHSSVTAYALLK